MSRFTDGQADAERRSSFRGTSTSGSEEVQVGGLPNTPSSLMCTSVTAVPTTQLASAVIRVQNSFRVTCLNASAQYMRKFGPEHWHVP